ncbi:MAG: YfcE family phosphodiesterase [Candidatus Lokiarchaeota archaeon]|nr:YfcE family phosphodiesterase [Candidatus Lokiarchaeota archaeon]
MPDLKIVIIGDTHLHSMDNFPEKMMKEIINSDWLIHTGDFISESVLETFIGIKQDKFIGVYGNADPLSIRKKLTQKKKFSIYEIRFGLVHPAEGGPDQKAEKRARRSFDKSEIDILIFGHTHSAKIERRGRLLILNPGKGYLEKSYYGPSTSYILLFISKEREINPKINYIE